MGAVKLRQNGEVRRPHHLQQDIEGALATALIVEQLVLAEDKGPDPIKHPAQLEMGKRALQRLGRFQAVLQQQNVAALDGRHIGGPPDPRHGVEVAAYQPPRYPTSPHRDQPVGLALLGPGLIFPIEPFIAPLCRGGQRAGDASFIGQHNL